MRCIWCRKETSAEPEEHIFPESLGCPNDLVFRNGEVCGKCNGRNGILDQALASEFDIFRLMANIPNKKGKPPRIATRPNAEGGYRDGKPYLNVNMERARTVCGTDRNLKPFANRPNDLEMMVEDGSSRQVKFTIAQKGFCNTKKCVRALHKIAFSVFARKFGVQEALAPRFDAVREYVRHGKGERTSLLAPAGSEYRNFACTSEGRVFPIEVVAFQLVVVGFTVDLSPAQESLQALKGMHDKVFGLSWTWSPIVD